MVEHGSNALDPTFAALASPVRRQMLVLLSRREMRVTELAAHFDMSLAAASKHIGQLEKAALANRQIIGRDHVIHFAPHPLADAADWLATFEDFWPPPGRR